MRRFAGCLAVLAILAAEARAADLQEIHQRGHLRVLVVFDSQRPEFFSMKPEAPGFDREILEGFAKLQRVRLDVVALPGWDAMIPALLADKGDVIANSYRVTESKKKSIAFTSDVFPSRMVVMTRKPRRVVHTLETLREEKVGTVKGTALAEAVAAAGVPRANVDDGIPVGGLADALRAGRVTAAVWGVESAIGAQREDPDLQLGMFIGDAGSLAFGVRKEDQRLRAALNEHIQNLHRSGAWSQLVVKYLGASAPQVLKKARAH